MCLSGRGNAMAKALRERDPRFAASTYKLSEALYNEARRQFCSALDLVEVSIA
jgi:hypothetical protein